MTYVDDWKGDGGARKVAVAIHDRVGEEDKQEEQHDKA